MCGMLWLLCYGYGYCYCRRAHSFINNSLHISMQGTVVAAASNTFVFVKDVSDVFDYSYGCDICYALLFYVEYYVLCVGHSFNTLLYNIIIII